MIARCAQEVRLATRRLLRAPLFTLFASLSLGLGLGTTVAIYSVIHALVLRPPAIDDVDEVVNVYHWNPAWGMATPSNVALSARDYADFKAVQSSLQKVSAWKPFRQTLTTGGAATMVFGEMVEGNYFDLLGVRASMGRTISPQDDAAGAPPVAVLSHALWRHKFAGDATIVGKTIYLGRHAFTIIGVMPAPFKGVFAPNLVATPLWVPLASASLVGGAIDGDDRNSRELYVKGRLRSGSTVASAAAEARTIAQRLDTEFPLTSLTRSYGTGPDPRRHRLWHVMPASDVRLHEGIHAYARMLTMAVEAIVVLALLVASTNVANLIIGRSSSRRHELAVRVAFGASRARLIAEHLIEAGVLLCAAAVVAAPVALLLMSGLLTFSVPIADGLITEVLPVVDRGVLVVGGLAAAAALLVCGLWPALHVTRGSLQEALATDNRLLGAPRWRWRQYLVAFQVAVSVALLAAALLCVQQADAYTRQNLGFDLDRLALVRLDFGAQDIAEAPARAIMREMVEIVRRERSVNEVALSSDLPSGFEPPYTRVRAVTFDSLAPREERLVKVLVSTPNIFRTLGVRLVAGRAFSDADDPKAPAVVILTERASRALFGRARDVLGSSVTLRQEPASGDVGGSALQVVMATVIGVAADEDAPSGMNARGLVIYAPIAQRYAERVVVVARASTDAATAAARMVEIVRHIAPRLAVTEAGTGLELAGPPMLPLQIVGTLTGGLGGLALILAMIGLYGGLSHVVAGRTTEIGIRMAVGATAREIQLMVVADGLRPVIGGLVIGLSLTASLWLSLRPLVARILPGAEPLVLMLSVPIAFIAVGLLASYHPARRAALTDPNGALRHL